jgi:anti-sigma28 factor (negative regulator of flagellin synthesis)
MKIYQSNMESLYSSISGSGKTSAKKNPGAVQETENVKTDISDVASVHDEIDELKSSAVQETEKGTDPDKLRALRDKISNGTYFVSGSDISAAMLKYNGIENN